MFTLKTELFVNVPSGLIALIVIMAALMCLSHVICNNVFFSLLLQDDFDTLRPLCYPETNVFLLCFSVMCPTSFHNVVDKWAPEIRRHCPDAPIILVGTQCDLRNDVKVLIELAHYNEKPVTEAEAQKLAEDIGALHYMECSALTQKNLKEVFDSAILSALDMFKRPKAMKRNKSFRKSKKDKKNKLAQPVLPIRPLSDCSVKKVGWKRFCCFV